MLPLRALRPRKLLAPKPKHDAERHVEGSHEHRGRGREETPVVARPIEVDRDRRDGGNAAEDKAESPRGVDAGFDLRIVLGGLSRNVHSL